MFLCRANRLPSEDCYDSILEVSSLRYRIAGYFRYFRIVEHHQKIKMANHNHDVQWQFVRKFAPTNCFHNFHMHASVSLHLLVVGGRIIFKQFFSTFCSTICSAGMYYDLYRFCSSVLPTNLHLQAQAACQTWDYLQPLKLMQSTSTPCMQAQGPHGGELVVNGAPSTTAANGSPESLGLLPPSSMPPVVEHFQVNIEIDVSNYIFKFPCAYLLRRSPLFGCYWCLVWKTMPW